MSSFRNVDRSVEVDIKWKYAKIVETMTTAGGVFKREREQQNMAAVATIFYRDADGYKTATQSIEIPVTVIDRTIIRTLVARLYDGDFEELAYTRTINPYEEPYQRKLQRSQLLLLQEGEGLM